MPLKGRNIGWIEGHNYKHLKGQSEEGLYNLLKIVSWTKYHFKYFILLKGSPGHVGSIH